MQLVPWAPPSTEPSLSLSWLAGSSLVPLWASVASDNPSEPPVQGCVVGKLARWLGAVECLSCSACGCGCLPPLIIIIKYNLAEGGWGELSDPPPRLPGSTGTRPCVVLLLQPLLPSPFTEQRSPSQQDTGRPPWSQQPPTHEAQILLGWASGPTTAAGGPRGVD